MAKLTLSDLANLQNESTAVSTLNNNNTAIENALETTLSRDGTSPNSMAADLDMDSNRILNLPDALTAQEPVTLSQLEAAIEDMEAVGFTFNAVDVDTPVPGDYILFGDVSASQDSDKATLSTIFGAADTAGTSSATPVAGDYLTFGDASDSEKLKKATITSVGTLVPGTIIPCTVSGTSVDIILTPTGGSVTLVDGMLFSFVPTTTPASGSLITVQIAGNTAKSFRAPDGAYASTYELQKNKPAVIQYYASGDYFVLVSAPLSFKQSVMSHGRGKLQADGATSISWTQENGRGLLVWNGTRAAYSLIDCPVITNSSLFTAVNYVEGVANQSLSANQLYAVYVFNTDATNDQAVALDFYRMYTGVATEAWTPVVNDLGIYTKRSAIGSGGYDNTRTYVGMVWTGSSDISTSLNGTTLRSSVCSLFSKWSFPAMSDVVSVSGITGSSTRATPIATIVSDGIDRTPVFELRANTRNDTSGQTNTIQLTISGTQYEGSSFSATSQTAKFTSTANNAWGQIQVRWGVAVPMGVFTVQPIVDTDGGTAEFDLDMQIYFAN